MRAQLVRDDGSAAEATAGDVRDALAAGAFFWLDITELGEDGAALLREEFGFHPLAVEDAEHFGQRPKLDTYDDFVFLVVHGALADASGTDEVHCFYASDHLVTVRRGRTSALDAVREQIGRRRNGHGVTPVIVLYLVIDILVDGFFPVLAALDDEIDVLEDAILERPTDEQLGRLFALKRALVGLRKVVTPQRDLFATLVSGISELPGMDPNAERYFRDLYDHLIRISDLVDSYRDLLSGAMDTHLATVSNRLNEVMKQLTIIATVFLPLSFLTGFFGQNFSWLVARQRGLPAFLGLALGLELVATVVLVAIFRRRGWFGGAPSAPRQPAGAGRSGYGLQRARPKR